MHVVSTKYTAHYENGIVVAQWVSVEMSLDGSNGESAFNALDRSQELVEQWYKSKNIPFHDNSIPPGPPPTIQVKPEDRETGVTPELILSSKDLTELESYRWHLKKNNELERAYMVRHDQLTQKQ